MAKRRVAAIVKIQLPAGKATPAPPVGTALGPHGVQTMDFCKQYNAATEDKIGSVIPVEITIYEDRTFTFILKTPPTPVLLRQAAGVEKGSGTSGREVIGTVQGVRLRSHEVLLPSEVADDAASLPGTSDEIREPSREPSHIGWRKGSNFRPTRCKES